MALLIVFGNLTDYNSNYYFVEHVMKMDTIFPSSSLHYRGIKNPLLYHAAYIIIIILELIIAVACVWGGIKMLRKIKAAGVEFHASKNVAVAGVLAGILLFFFGFEVIGGEWFAMWQSNSANGLPTAERIVSFLVLTLILLHHKDE